MALLGKWAAKLDGQSDAASNEALERVLLHVQGERQRVETAVESLNGYTTRLPQVQDALDTAAERAEALSGRLDDLSARIDNVGRSAGNVADLEKRLAALEQGLREAEARAGQATERVRELEDQRDSLQQLVAAAAGAQGLIETLKKDSADLEALGRQLPEVREEHDGLRRQQVDLKNGIERLAAVAASLTGDATAARDTSQDAHAKARAAAETLAQVLSRLDDVSRIEILARDTTSELQTLNALAEHVTSKLKALEHQHQTIERALVESQRVTEMVWNMDVQIAKLNEGSTLAGRVEESLARLERLHQDTTAAVDQADRVRTEFTGTLEQHQREAAELLQQIQVGVKHLGVNRREIDTLGERLAVAQAALADVEQRIGALAAAGEMIGALGEKSDALSRRFEALTTHASTLEDRQAALAVVQQRLDEVEATAKRTEWQMESLAEHRRQLEQLQEAFQEFDAVHTRAVALTDKLRADEHDLAQLVERTAGFMRDLPQTVAAVDALKAGVAQVEASAQRATGMKPAVDALLEDTENLLPRLRTVEQLQTRLGELHDLSMDIDRRLAAQLARQAEIDSIRIACDGLSTRLTDAQHAVEGLAAAQARLGTVPAQVARLDADLAATAGRVTALQQDEEALAAQEERLQALHESAGVLAHELAGRLETLRRLQLELDGARDTREQLGAEIAQLQGLQRETLASAREAQDHVQQLAAQCRQIDERKAHVELAERAVAALEARLNTLDRTAASVDAKIDAIAGRERVVDAVRQEVEAVHHVAHRVQEDLAATVEGHAQIAHAREEVQRLLDALAAMTGKISEVEARGGAVEDVRRKCDAVIRLLDDMRVTLDTVSEQKAMFDHVSENLLRLDNVITEARGTTKALQAERKLAQRIVENIRSVHARAGSEIR